MSKSKPFWKSKTFWGAVVSALPIPLAPVIGAGVMAIPDTPTVIPPGSEDPVVTIIQATIQILGAILVIYGRQKAEGKLIIREK